MDGLQKMREVETLRELCQAESTTYTNIFASNMGSYTWHMCDKRYTREGEDFETGKQWWETLSIRHGYFQCMSSIWKKIVNVTWATLFESKQAKRANKQREQTSAGYNLHFANSTVNSHVGCAVTQESGLSCKSSYDESIVHRQELIDWVNPLPEWKQCKAVSQLVGFGVENSTCI